MEVFYSVNQLVLQRRFDSARELIKNQEKQNDFLIHGPILYIESFLAQGFIGKAISETKKRLAEPQLNKDARFCLLLYDACMKVHEGKVHTACQEIANLSRQISSDPDLSMFTKVFAKDMVNRGDIIRLKFGLLNPLYRADLIAETASIAKEYQELGRKDKEFAAREREASMWLDRPMENRKKAIKLYKVIQEDARNMGWKMVEGNAALQLAELICEDNYLKGGGELQAQMKLFESAAHTLEEDGGVSTTAFVEAKVGLLCIKYGVSAGEEILKKAAKELSIQSDAILLNEIWNKLDTYYHRIGNERGIQEAVEQRREIHGWIDTPMIEHNNQLSLANQAYRQGKIALARNLLNKLLENKDIYSNTASLSILANVVGAINDRKNAILFLDRAVSGMITNGPSTFLSHTYYMQASQCMDTELELAIGYLEKALEVDRAIGDQRSEGQHLGLIAWIKARNRYKMKYMPVMTEEIDIDFQRACELLLPFKDIDSIEDLINICQNRGQAYMFENRYSQMEFWFEQALALADGVNLGMKKVNTLSMIGLAYIGIGRKGNKTAYRQAKKYIDQAVEFYQDRDILDMKWRAYFFLAMTTDEWGRLEQRESVEQKEIWKIAIDSYESSAVVIEEMRMNVSVETGVRRQKDVSLFGINKQTLLRAGFIFHAIHRQDTSRALTWLERMKSQSLLDGLIHQNAIAVAESMANIINWDGIKSILMREEEFLEGRQIIVVSYYIDENICISLGMRSDWDSPRYERIFLEYPRFSTFIRQHFRYPDGVRQFMTDIGEGPWQSFQNLIFPLSFWSKPGDVVCLVPFGVLHDLPLHSLQIDGKYLIERNPVFYCPSLSVLKYVLLQDKQKSIFATESISIFGDPTGDLPFARQEANFIQELFKVDAVFGAEITIDALKEGITSSELLHFAGHGNLSVTDGFDSGLALSNHEFLRAKEVMELKSSLQLIVLSGCETGVSHHFSGDELFGMVHALLYAQVNSLLVSQWMVSDQPTLALFKEFYEVLENGGKVPKVIALQRAILAIKASFPHWNFYHWGGFVLIGDWK